MQAPIEEAAPLLRSKDARVPSLCRCCVACCAVLLMLLLYEKCTTVTTFGGGVGINATETYDQVIRLRASSTNPSAAAVILQSVLKDAGGAGNNGYFAAVSNAAPYFHAEGTCKSVAKTSTTASRAGCRYAVNAGPFSSYWRGGCIGPTISHGRVLSEDWNTSYASFGLTAEGEWIMGHLSQAVHSQFSVVEAVTGFGWLVRDGKSVAPADAQLAERTAVGVNARGDLLLLQVDGCERCPFSGGASGLTLQQLAQLLIRQGALHAINLDGGGSSSTVIDGKVKNRPDCLELGVRCERSVTSVLCVASHGSKELVG